MGSDEKRHGHFGDNFTQENTILLLTHTVEISTALVQPDVKCYIMLVYQVA